MDIEKVSEETGPFAFEAELSIGLVWEGWKGRKQKGSDRKQYGNSCHCKLFTRFLTLKKDGGKKKIPKSIRKRKIKFFST